MNLITIYARMMVKKDYSRIYNGNNSEFEN